MRIPMLTFATAAIAVSLSGCALLPAAMSGLGTAPAPAASQAVPATRATDAKNTTAPASGGTTKAPAAAPKACVLDAAEVAKVLGEAVTAVDETSQPDEPACTYKGSTMTWAIRNSLDKGSVFEGTKKLYGKVEERPGLGDAAFTNNVDGNGLSLSLHVKKGPDYITFQLINTGKQNRAQILSLNETLAKLALAKL